MTFWECNNIFDKIMIIVFIEALDGTILITRNMFNKKSHQYWRHCPTQRNIRGDKVELKYDT